MSAAIPSLQVIGSPHMGGAETTFLRLSQALATAGHPTHGLVRPGSDLRAYLDASALPYSTAPMRNFIDLGSVVQVRHEIERLRVPVVQSWASRATWLTRPPSNTLHVARLGGYYKLRYFRHADAWVVNTRGLRDWMVGRGFPPERVEWISNFVPESQRQQPAVLGRAELGIPPEALVVMGLGRFVGKKGFDLLIEAFARLPAELGGRPLHLVLIGDGRSMADLRTQAAPLGPRAHFTGWMDQQLAMLRLADVFVCPSRIEPLGNVVLEAWSQGVAVVCTETAGGSELIQSGDNGLLCPVEDVPRMQTQIERVLRDESLRAGLASHGYSHYQHRYSERRTVEAYTEFFRRLLRDGHAGRARQSEW